MADKIEIELPENYHACLIIEKPTGIVYQTQAGGHACAQPEAEGFVVFLDYFDTKQVEYLVNDRWHTKEEWLEWSGFTRDFRDALAIHLAGARDGALKSIALAFDETREPDEQWGEAWVPITCTYGRGWLTWPNSD